MHDADRHLLTIFSAALERESAGERAAYLDEACAGAPDLRARVEALLRAHSQAGRFLEPDEVEATADPSGHPHTPDATGTASYGAPAEAPGATIGPYRLLQVIGEGGMGTVYMAEQTEPVRRRVALKVVKPGMDSRQVLARFAAERQALAMMDHPDIARVLDAGTTDTGRPFFVMELVKGVPITRFCDERKLTPRERLELFVPVCQAVQHAHQKGVIHRDLKPSNVLVALYDDKPVPKVIDFGIAKATGPKLTEQTVFTEFGAVIGTLEYMSPEQAQLNQLDIDTRSDIYSLGVLLYELLTGTTPLQRQTLGRAALLDVLRLIREAETPRPSLRLSTAEGLPSIAADRGLEPRKLRGLVRGDLDWIVMKALEKDRRRRYETANALARDLQRYLADEAIEARPPSAAYRLGKFARRHRLGLAVGATIAAVLVLATAVSTWQAVRATHAERHAVETAEILRQTNDFFINDLLGKSRLEAQARAEIRPDPDIKVRTLVDRAAGRIDGRFADQPLVEAAVRNMVGKVYQSLGLAARARPHLERAYEIRRRLLGEGHAETIDCLGMLGAVEAELSLYDRAEARLRRALELACRWQGEESSLANVIRVNLARCLNNSGRYAEAEALQRLALEIGRRGGDADQLNAIVIRNNLAVTLIHRGAEPEAEALLREALQDARQALGDDHPMTPLLLVNLADLLSSRGRFAEADKLARQALEASRRTSGDRHPRTLGAMRSLGSNFLNWGRPDQAEAVLRPRLEAARQGFGEGSEQAVDAAADLAELLRKRNRWAEAEALLVEAKDSARRLGPLVQARVAIALGNLYVDMGRHPEAERELRAAESELDGGRLSSVQGLITIKLNLSNVHTYRGRHEQAVDILREALALSERACGEEHITTYKILVNLASACRIAGRLDEAEALFPRVIALGRRLLGPEHETVFSNEQNYAALLHVRGRFEQAEALYRACFDGLRRTVGPEGLDTLIVLSNLGELYRDWGRLEQAEAILGQALEVERRVLGPDHTQTLWTLWKIAEMDRDRGRFDEAEAKFLRCLEGYTRVQDPDSADLATLRADLALNYLRAGEPARAEPLLREALGAHDRLMPDHWRRFEIQGQLGQSLADQGRYAEAEPLVLEGYEGLTARRDQITVDARPRLPEAGERVVRLYEAWGKPEQVDRWRGKLPPEGDPGTRPSPKPGTVHDRLKPFGASDGPQRVILGRDRPRAASRRGSEHSTQGVVRCIS